MIKQDQTTAAFLIGLLAMAGIIFTCSFLKEKDQTPQISQDVQEAHKRISLGVATDKALEDAMLRNLREIIRRDEERRKDIEQIVDFFVGDENGRTTYRSNGQPFGRVTFANRESKERECEQ